MVDIKAEDVSNGGVPSTITRFFENTGGHSLIIRGAAGTGKSTLALEILSLFGGLEKGKYISSRTSDEMLKNQFPWMFSPGGMEGQHPFTRDSLNKLEGLVQDGMIDSEGVEERFPPQVEGNSVMIEIGEDLPEMEEAYAFVESVHPQKSLLVFDSVDGLSERYGMSKERLMHTIQHDLVEGNQANVVFILERSGSSPLDYLGDGVIELSFDILEGRIVRYLRFEKMRGMSLGNPKRSFTLLGGRLFSPEPVVESQLPLQRSLSMGEDTTVPAGHFSLNEQLFSFLSSGDFPNGGIHLIMSKGSSELLATAVETHLVASSLDRGWGVAWVPSRRSSIKPEERLPSSAVSNMDESHLRIFEVPITSPSPFTAPLIGNDIYSEMGPSKLSDYLPQIKGPYVYILDIPQLTTVIARGEGKIAKSQLSFFLSVLATGGNNVFCLVADASPFVEIIKEHARTEIHMDRRHGNFLLHGEKPFTPS
ncbi:MAG: hypothetical protein KAT70_00190, partial [Thermoplasmata archaeon]|nr:hypothetical protein [Thermoplasmata archaeon]